MKVVKNGVKKHSINPKKAKGGTNNRGKKIKENS